MNHQLLFFKPVVQKCTSWSKEHFSCYRGTQLVLWIEFKVIFLSYPLQLENSGLFYFFDRAGRYFPRITTSRNMSRRR